MATYEATQGTGRHRKPRWTTRLAAFVQRPLRQGIVAEHDAEFFRAVVRAEHADKAALAAYAQAEEAWGRRYEAQADVEEAHRRYQEAQEGLVQAEQFLANTADAWDAERSQKATEAFERVVPNGVQRIENAVTTLIQREFEQITPGHPDPDAWKTDPAWQQYYKQVYDEDARDIGEELARQYGDTDPGLLETMYEKAAAINEAADEATEAAVVNLEQHQLAYNHATIQYTTAHAHAEQARQQAVQAQQAVGQAGRNATEQKNAVMPARQRADQARKWLDGETPTPPQAPASTATQQSRRGRHVHK